jgi:peptidase C25-like protein
MHSVLFHNAIPNAFIKAVIVVSILLGPINAYSQSTSVLKEGKWVKMHFESSGIYKIDFSLLSAMGFDPNELDPRNLSVYGNKGGMLPQSNASARSLDLDENSIYVFGESDGVFNLDDYLLFYVDEVNTRSFNTFDNSFSVEKNVYSDELYYFVTLKSSNGKRVSENANLEGDFPIIDIYNNIIYHEADLFNILGSGRKWFGERFDNQNENVFDLEVNNVAPGLEVSLMVSAMAQSFNSSSMDLSLNDQEVGELSFSPIPNARYTVKGSETTKSFLFSSDQITPSSKLKFVFNRNGSSSAIAYLNNFLLDIPSKTILENDQLSFRSIASLQNPISQFHLENLLNESKVWNVSNPVHPRNQEINLINDLGTFGDFSNDLQEYVLFNPSQVNLVDSYEAIENQNLHEISTPEFLIITTGLFQQSALRLADFRRINDGLSSEVINVNKIYNEFSSGRQDISAIRDFIRHLYLKDNQLKNVLFLGRGSYDFKDRVPNNTNYVPTYESRNSLDPLKTYSSDDFFGFLDESEGDWAESIAGDHILDIGIGRIPVKTTAEAEIAVSKIIDYQSAEQTLGDWRSKVVFVADDGDFNIHQRDANNLATMVDTSYVEFEVQKLFLDAYEQEQKPNGEFSPKAKEALQNYIEDGTLILNFTGHGAETGWMQEQILDLALIDDLSNEFKLPLFVTATCEFGRNDDPAIVSGAEKIMLKNEGGAIALITTARPVFSSTNYTLNEALYETVLKKENGLYPTLGDVIRYTKNNSLNGSSNRNFILLGDPSMRLAYPSKEIVIQSINGKEINPSVMDTLNALENVEITGQIENGGLKDESFNGTVSLVLKDKSTVSQTFGTDSPVFEFEESTSVLFNGTATVNNGAFSIDFVIPRNIQYNWGTGKIKMYATPSKGLTDAIGAKNDIIIGGTSQVSSVDNTPPVIIPFLNDTLSQMPFSVKSDAVLLVKISDENGINISESGVGQEITAVLNDSALYNLNSYFITNENDFSEGWVNFPLRNLPNGENRIVIKAWDNYNNSQISALEFIVNDDNSTLITNIRNYPNPLVDNTTFSIAHNSAGEHVELAVEIFNIKGEKITSLYEDIDVARSIEEINWNGTNFEGARLSKGLYIYNVILRTIGSDRSDSKRQKLIISN